MIIKIRTSVIYYLLPVYNCPVVVILEPLIFQNVAGPPTDLEFEDALMRMLFKSDSMETGLVSSKPTVILQVESRQDLPGFTCLWITYTWWMPCSGYYESTNHCQIGLLSGDNSCVYIEVYFHSLEGIKQSMVQFIKQSISGLHFLNFVCAPNNPSRTPCLSTSHLTNKIHKLRL